jgi:hypothetical protein
MIRNYLYAFVAAVLAFGGIFLYGKGRNDQKDKLSRDNLDAMRQAKDVRDEIHDDPYFVDRARQWVKED